MANILLITSIYSSPNLKLYGSTDVCHFFVKEWIKLGHNVKVIYNYTTYAPILHYISRYFSHKIASIFPAVINSTQLPEPLEYEYEGVNILLNPIYKGIPKTSFKSKEISKNAERSIQWLKKLNYNPDIIVGHFLYPQLQVIPIINKEYNARTALIAHGKYDKKRDKIALDSNIGRIDNMGFRSLPIMSSFSSIKSINNRFLCPSGIPTEYIDDSSWTKHQNESPKSFLFVGNFMSRKFPFSVVKSFCKISSDNDFLKMIGTGSEYKKIKKFIDKKRINNIHLLGRISRNEVMETMANSEIFVMISKDETFGLVYLEAMAKGCIVIASKNEGMEGIIKHGTNGFLCQAGNDDELAQLLFKIKEMPADNRIIISKNAINTVKDLTDCKVAKEYLNNLKFTTHTKYTN